MLPRAESPSHNNIATESTGQRCCISRTMSAGCVPATKSGEVQGDRSGKFDDRWAFTNCNTGLQYEVAPALAAASRVLKDCRGDLAAEALKCAEQLWQYERTHPSNFSPNSYVSEDDGGFHRQELAATAELLITTGDAKYRDRLMAMLPVLKGISGEQFGTRPGWILARAMSKVDDAGYEATVTQLAGKWKAVADSRAASNPWAV